MCVIKICLFVYSHWLKRQLFLMNMSRFSWHRHRLPSSTSAAPLRILVLLLSFNFFSWRLDPTIPYKHSETGLTLLMWPLLVKTSGEDVSLGLQTPVNLSCIPLWTLLNSEDITDAPLACKGNRLKKRTKLSWQHPVPPEMMKNSRYFILVRKPV